MSWSPTHDLLAVRCTEMMMASKGMPRHGLALGREIYIPDLAVSIDPKTLRIVPIVGTSPEGTPNVFSSMT